MLAGKKFLLVHSSAGLYGADRCLGWIAEYLIEAGVKVDAVLPFDGPLNDELNKHGVEVHQMDPVVFRRNLKKPGNAAKFLSRSFSSVNNLRSLIKANNYDLVHTNTGVTIGGAIAARMTKTPHVWHFREILTEFGVFLRIHEPVVTGTSEAIVCISSAVASQFQSRKSKGKIEIVYDGIPLTSKSWLDGIGFQIGSPVRLLTVGLLAPYKGQDILLEACKELKEQGHAVELNIVGGIFGNDSSFRDELIAKINNYGMNEDVRLHGFQQKVEHFVENADIFVHPSTRPEGLGLVVLEAMAKGVPVIASDHGGVKEIITDGKNGLLVPPGDSHSMAEAIKEISFNPAKASHLARNGSLAVIQQFSLEQSHMKLRHIYERVLKAR